MKNAIVVLMLGAMLLMMGCASQGTYSVTGMGSNQGSVAIAAGKVLADKKAEIGITGVFYDPENKSNEYDPAFGVYAAREMPLPFPLEESLTTYIGAAPMLETETWKPIFTPFIAGVLYPHESVSPIYMYKYNILDGSIDESTTTEGSEHFFGLRILTY